MKLRKAVEKDFESFKILFEDTAERYQWLYQEEERPRGEMRNLEYDSLDYIDEIVEKDYRNYSFERFQKDIESKEIYMIEEKQIVLGYIRITKERKNTHRIYEWALFNPQECAVKTQVLEIVKKIPHIQKLEISTLCKSVEKFLEANGFKQTSIGFYELEIPKRTS